MYPPRLAVTPTGPLGPRFLPYPTPSARLRGRDGNAARARVCVCVDRAGANFYVCFQDFAEPPSSFALTCLRAGPSKDYQRKIKYKWGRFKCWVAERQGVAYGSGRKFSSTQTSACAGLPAVKGRRSSILAAKTPFYAPSPRKFEPRSCLSPKVAPLT